MDALHLTGPDHVMTALLPQARPTSPVARGTLPSDRIRLAALPESWSMHPKAPRHRTGHAAPSQLFARPSLISPPGPRRPTAPQQTPSAACAPAAHTMHLAASWQGHHVLRAIDEQDIIAITHIRDQDLRLLLRPVGHTTPLVYAMRLGPEHVSMTVVLVGFFSRFVNNITDAMLLQPDMHTTLRAIRSNLRVAIQFGIQNRCTDLIASYLQVIVMSEGQKWMQQCATSVGRALVVADAREAMQVAGRGVAQFLRDELDEKTTNSALDDYITNATTDLFLMGCLSAASQNSWHIPAHYFARDDRVLQAFIDAIRQLERAEHVSAPPKFMRLCGQVIELMKDTRIHPRAKMLRLARLPKPSERARRARVLDPA